MSFEDRMAFKVLFYTAADNPPHNLRKTILELIRARYRRGIEESRDGTFPLPPLNGSPALSPGTLSPWQTTWSRTHELSCQLARDIGLLGKMNVYISACHLWKEAASAFREELERSLSHSWSPAGYPPRLHLVKPQQNPDPPNSRHP